MKLFKRSPIIYNLLIYLVLSSLFLFVLTALNNGESSFDIKKLLAYLLSNTYLYVLLVVSLITTFCVRRWSKVFIISFLILIFYHEMIIFFYKFDKIVLVLVSFHVLVSFYYYLLWDIELGDVVYCPGFSKHDCGKKYLYDFDSEIELENGIILPVKLTNWDRRGIFCLIDESDCKVSKKVLIRIKFEDAVFEETGQIVSSYGQGYGIKFMLERNKNSEWGWGDFYTIIRDRGYTPDFVRV